MPEPIIVFLHHAPEEQWVPEVKRKMKKLGSPEIVVFQVSDHIYIAPEGTHRLTAAKQLQLAPTLQLLGKEHHHLDWSVIRPDKDFDGILEITVEEMRETMRSHLETNFDELPRIMFRQYKIVPWTK